MRSQTRNQRRSTAAHCKSRTLHALWRVVVLGLVALPARPAMAQNTIRLDIANEYVASINAGIGTARRAGTDSVVGTLTFQSDSTWTGVVEAKVRFKQAMEAFGVAVCPEADYEGSQRLQLSGTKAGGFNPASQTIIYSTGTADGGFLELTVQPVGPPVMNSMDCLSLYEDAAWSFPLLPLNDARWNQLTSGYVIGLPQSGLVVYTDSTLRAFQTNLNPAQPAGASSSWKIRVDRR